MMSSHTPEPWKAVGRTIHDANGLLVLTLALGINRASGLTEDMQRREAAVVRHETAAHIVACVNACAGIANPEAVGGLIRASRRLAAWHGCSDQMSNIQLERDTKRLHAALAALEEENDVVRSHG